MIRKKGSYHKIRNLSKREERKRLEFNEADKDESIEAGGAEDVNLGDAEGTADPGEGRVEAVEGRGRRGRGRVAAGEVDDGVGRLLLEEGEEGENEEGEADVDASGGDEAAGIHGGWERRAAVSGGRRHCWEKPTQAQPWPSPTTAFLHVTLGRRRQTLHCTWRGHRCRAVLVLMLNR